MKAMFSLFMVIALLTGFGLSLPFQAVAAEPITLKMSATQPLTHPNYLAQKYLADLLEKRALDRTEIEILKKWASDIEKILHGQSLRGTDTLSGNQ